MRWTNRLRRSLPLPTPEKERYEMKLRTPKDKSCSKGGKKWNFTEGAREWQPIRCCKAKYSGTQVSWLTSLSNGLRAHDKIYCVIYKVLFVCALYTLLTRKNPEKHLSMPRAFVKVVVIIMWNNKVV